MLTCEFLSLSAWVALTGLYFCFLNHTLLIKLSFYLLIVVQTEHIVSRYVLIDLVDNQNYFYFRIILFHITYITINKRLGFLIVFINSICLKLRFMVTFLLSKKRLIG